MSSQNEFEKSISNYLKQIAVPENVCKRIFDIWSRLISNPAKPPEGKDVPDPRLLYDGAAITGISVSISHDALPQGRWTCTNIESSRFAALNLDKSGKASNLTWATFSELLLHAYWDCYGREAAIGHSVLHSKTEAVSSRVLHIDFGTPGKRENGLLSAEVTKPDSFHLGEISVNGLGQHLPFYNDTTRGKLSALFSDIAESAVSLNPTLQEDYIELSREVVERASKKCFRHTLEQAHLHLYAAICQQEPETRDVIRKCIFGYDSLPTDESEHERDGDLKRALRCLELLVIFRHIGTRHFYALRPVLRRNRADVNGVVLTCWSDVALTAESLIKLHSVAETILCCLHQHLDKNDVTRGEHDRKATIAILGSDVASTFETAFNPFAYKVCIGAYLALADRLATAAIHEGKPLQFRLHISGGNAASRNVQFVSGFKKPLKWTLRNADNIEGFSEKGLDDPSVISILLGNFSFFQDEKYVVQADFEGSLHYLGQLIGPSDPEHATDKGDNIIISVEKGGDIKVFFAGSPCPPTNLRLWRRGGKWLVPAKYGKGYVEALSAWLNGIFSAQSGWEVLANCAWELSVERKGASFIVLKDSASASDERLFQPMTEVLLFAEDKRLLTETGKRTLLALAVQDGATVIDASTMRVYGRRRIVASGSLPASEDSDALLHHRHHWGSRHYSGMCCVSDDRLKGKGCAIVVSSDGDIHLFDDKGPVSLLCFPRNADKVTS